MGTTICYLYVVNKLSLLKFKSSDKHAKEIKNKKTKIALDKHGLFGNIIGGNIIVIGATDSVVQVLMQEESKLTMKIPKYGKLFLRKVLI